MSIRRKAFLALLLGLALPGAQWFATVVAAPDTRKSAESWCAVHYASTATSQDTRRLCALWGYRR